MMELPEILFLGIVLYLLYRFVFNFCLPIVRTTRQVRQQFRNVQETMRNQQGQQQGSPQGNPFQQSQQPGHPNSNTFGKSPPSNTDGLGEYIDFEEIK